MASIRDQAKAIVSGLIAGGGALGTALADGTVTPVEWTVVAVAALVAYQGVFWTGQPVSLPRLESAGARAFLATVRTSDLVDLVATRLSTSEAVTLAQRVGAREDRERAR